MPIIIYTKPDGELEKALKAKVVTFLDKLGEDDALPGLHIEPLNNVADSRVRTGRVDQAYRAVVFKLATQGTAVYVYAGVWHHDEAIKRAKTMVLDQNPISGVPQFSQAEETAEPDAAATGGGDVKEETQPPLLVQWGYSLEDLTERLGLTQARAHAAMIAPDEDSLLEVAGRASDVQGLMLLDLCTGSSIDDIRVKYGLDEPAAQDPEKSADENLIDAFRHPAAQASFTFIDDSAELRRVIEGGDFAAWRVFLHPEQRKYASREYNGPFRLSGGAGTGKTVVLLHRAVHLARENPEARVVLTTYTRNLAEMLRAQVQQLDPDAVLAPALEQPGIYIAGVDQLAAQVLRDAGAAVASSSEALLGSPVTHVNNHTDRHEWRNAIARAGTGLPEQLLSPAFFETEYSMVVLPNRIRNRSEYFSVARQGRGVALNRGMRSKVWSVIEDYRSASRVAGTIDFDEKAAIAAEYCKQVVGDARLADHVLVDEGQDLSPARWQLLRALAPEGPNDMFIAEDSHQRIYGQPVVLGRLGIRIVGRSQRMTLNYRTTAQNLAFAVNVLDGGDYVDLEEAEESTSEYHSSRLGPVPQVVECTGLSDELDKTAAAVSAWLEAGDTTGGAIGILVRDQSQQTRVVTGLSERGVTVRPVSRDTKVSGTMPSVLTMHRAKGTEFAKVVLFGVSEGSIPAALKSEKYSEDAWDDAMLRERSLLYVAATRARDELVVTWSGVKSELLS